MLVFRELGGVNMAYRCILDSRKECDGCGECQEKEDEEIKRDILEEKEYQMLIEKGLI